MVSQDVKCYNQMTSNLTKVNSLSKIIRNVVKKTFSNYIMATKKGKQYNIDLKSQDLQVKKND